ncbi:MAG: anti-sigma-F factor Fin [Bacillus sp. (in: firmicutes)]
MNINYTCRHCRRCIGILPGTDVEWKRLGIEQLSDAEKDDMVAFIAGDIHVKIICNHCEDAYDANPLLHEMDFIIQ